MWSIIIFWCALCLVASTQSDTTYSPLYQGALVRPRPLNEVDLVCRLLQELFPDRVSFQEEKDYQVQQNTYWAAQQAEEIRPKCRIKPTDTSELSLAIQVIGSQNAKFAIKSGGHAFMAGASNVDRGITIDMAAFATVQISKDGRAVALGSAARWRDVYTKLEPHGLTVSGGRGGDIGVGGFLLFGGYSWYSNLEGWACDTVLNFEVVLADGSIVDANVTSHPNLFWALKGGGNNFGIVTGFTLRTLLQQSFFGGGISYDISNDNVVQDLMTSLGRLTKDAAKDPYASGYFSAAYVPVEARMYTTAMLVHLSGRNDSPLLEPFGSIPYIYQDLAKTNISNVARLLDESNEAGFRQYKATLTFENSPPLLVKIVNTFKSQVATIPSHSEIRPGITIQPITALHLAHSDNALGLSSKDGSLILFSLEFRWTNPLQDLINKAELRRMIREYEAMARELGLLHRWVYANYAADFQEPFVGYGPESTKRLRKVRELYDPRWIFTKGQPGSFSIP